MNALPSSSTYGVTDSWEEPSAPLVEERVERRPSAPSQGGRWWFAFDRWFAVADADDDFVLG